MGCCLPIPIGYIVQNSSDELSRSIFPGKEVSRKSVKDSKFVQKASFKTGFGCIIAVRTSSTK